MNSNLLLVGAGGLGCEALATGALMGFSSITVIDMDTIDLSNLNRQFLFTEADIGRPKAEVACEYVLNRLADHPLCPRLTPIYGRLEDQTDAFYLSFDVIIAGLDSVSARQWLNSTLIRLALEDKKNIRPFIDGGTEGLRGQIRTIIPTISPCYECTMDLVTPAVTFPLCTIAHTPRLPEHCVEYVTTIEWPEAKPFGEDTPIDGDNLDHIRWILDRSQSRSYQFRITGVTWQLVQGVVKRIIPAVASTNAVIAAGLVNEAYKIVFSSPKDPLLTMDNYMYISGTERVYSYTFHYDKKEDCPVCGIKTETVDFPQEASLAELLEYLKGPKFNLEQPTLTDYTNSKPVFMTGPPMLRKAFEKNLGFSLGTLVPEGQLVIQDLALDNPMHLKIHYINKR